MAYNQNDLSSYLLYHITGNNQELKILPAGVFLIKLLLSLLKSDVLTQFFRILLKLNFTSNKLLIL